MLSYIKNRKGKGVSVLYLENFTFPNKEQEFDFFLGIKRSCYDSYYPFQVLSTAGVGRLDFAPITILYGSNGSGKTTALNIIAEKLNLNRESPFNKSNFFLDYTNLCQFESIHSIPDGSRIITSDDVFDYMLDIRTLNDGIDRKREDLFKDYLDTKYSDFKFRTLEDYEQLKKVNSARKMTQSKYIRNNLLDNVREQSNGENAFSYFIEKIQENALYLLDEPENSLSAQKQLELVEFLENSTRFFGCQFIISTHSPFVLSMKNARIYDMDEHPICKKKWTELKNVRIFYDFFMAHEEEFQ